MVGVVFSFLKKQWMGEQICLIFLLNGSVGGQEVLVKDEDMKDMMWIEFYIVDIGIGILGVFVFEIFIIVFFFVFYMIFVNQVFWICVICFNGLC